MRTRQAINEAFKADILRALFHINKNKHINIKGKEEDPLSVDGANFALAFPIQWDKLEDKNLRFIVDNDFESYIPKNGSFNGKSVANTAIRGDKAKSTMSRYAIDSFMSNSDTTGEMTRKMNDAYRRFGEIERRYGSSKSEESEEVKLICDTIRDFLEMVVMRAKENDYMSDEKFQILSDWEKNLDPSILKLIPKNVVDFVNDCFNKRVDKQLTYNRGEEKHKVMPGVHYEKAAGHDYLSQYNDVSDLVTVSVSDFMDRVNSDEYKEVFDKNAKEALKDAISDYENSTNGELSGYLPDRSFITTYGQLRVRQFKDLPELTFVTPADAKDGEPHTRQIISNEQSVLTKIYREVKNSDKMRRSSEVYDIITRILTNKNTTTTAATEAQKGKMLSHVLDLVTKKSDEKLLARTGDFYLTILMGANLEIRYVVSSVYLDPMNYNLVGTYNKQYVYGWRKGLPLTTVESNLLRRMRSVSDEGKEAGEQLVNCNVISKNEIMDNIDTIHCALLVGGTLSDEIESDDEITVNKYILGNLGNENTEISTEKTNTGKKNIVSGDLNIVAEQLDKRGIPYEKTRRKGEEVLVVSPEYRKELKEIAKAMRITSYAINETFDELDDLYKDFNIFLDNAITDKVFANKYVSLFEKVNKNDLEAAKSRLRRIAGNIVEESHILNVIDKIRQDAEPDNDEEVSKMTSAQVRINTDMAIIEELNAASEEVYGKGKPGIRFNSVYAKLQGPINDAYGEINKAFEVNRVGLRVDTDAYTTLGQNARAYSSKVISRYNASKDAVLTDRELRQKAPEASSFRDSAQNQDELKAVANVRNVIYQTLNKLQDTNVTIKGSGSAKYTGKELLKYVSDQMGANFISIDTIKTRVNDIVSESINAINRLDDNKVARSALSRTANYVRDNVRILNALTENVKDVENDKPIDEATQKTDLLKTYLNKIMDATEAYRTVMERYGIYLTSKGPGE